MTTMIERVARAILEESKSFGALAHTSDQLERRLARAAIKEMRKPTKEMHRAAWNSCERGNHAIDPNPGWDEYNEKVFAAMIDAALSEEPR